MKKVTILIMSLMLISSVSALDIDLNINIENPGPTIWISDTTISPEDREGNYALSGFPGETVEWNFLARSPLGMEKMTEVYVTKDGSRITSCRYETYSGYVDFADTNYESSTDIYGVCTFGVHPDWHGTSDIETLVDDILGESDSESFNMFFNPQITLSASLPTLNVNGLAGESVLIGTNVDLFVEGGAQARLYIHGTDFYDSSSSPAKCPVTNKFDVTNIEYSADGSPFNILRTYEQELGIFSNDFQLNFRVNIPSPCIGSFDQGTISITGEIV